MLAMSPHSAKVQGLNPGSALAGPCVSHECMNLDNSNLLKIRLDCQHKKVFVLFFLNFQ